MNAYTEFFIENGRLTAHVEYYTVKTRHYYDYELNATDTNTLKRLFSVETDDDLIKHLTKTYSLGNDVLNFFTENAIHGEIHNKGYEDTSSDI